MYCLLLLATLLSIIDHKFAQSSTSALCQQNILGTGKYCRSLFPRRYGPPHNTYHGNSQATTEVTPNPTPNTSPSPIVKYGPDLAQNLIEAELAIRRYCLENSNVSVKETLRNNLYVLNYTLEDQGVKDVSVQIKHTVIYVVVKTAGFTILQDIRILPVVLNTEKASWAFGINGIEIFIPLGVLNSDNPEKCNRINETLITVPASSFIYKFGEVIQDKFTPNPDGDSNIHTATTDNVVINEQNGISGDLDDVTNFIFGEPVV